MCELMNVYRVKCNTLMMQHEDQYTCLLCEHRVRLEFLPEGSNCSDGVCESFRVEGAKEYNDV